MDRRALVLAVAGFWALLVAPAVHAQVTVLQNDSYTSGSFTCVQGFAENDTMAVKLTAAPATYPYKIDRIRVLACGGEAAYGVSIWQDTGGVNPGPALWQSADTYLMGASDAFYEVVPTSPVVVTAGTVRVGLTQLQSFSFLPGFGRDNAITLQRNLIQDTGTWDYAENFGVSGDFVLRLLVVSDVIFKDGFET
jgi:hypothetical protein